MGLDIFFVRKTSKEIGYFRKVNFLVKFFEDKGFDTPNQTPLIICKEDAEELLERCNQVLEDHTKAKELLPTTDGFFFGSTNYDEYYYNDVKKVRDFIVDTLIPAFNNLHSNQNLYFETWF